jgi:hypothetical protein
MPRRPGPFLEGRKFKDIIDHERHTQYWRRKAQAIYRQEGWSMTLEEYFNLWTRDLWPQRGRKRDELVMIRRDVEKPWSHANCCIVTRYQQLCRFKKMRIPGYKKLEI